MNGGKGWMDKIRERPKVEHPDAGGISTGGGKRQLPCFCGGTGFQSDIWRGSSGLLPNAKTGNRAVSAITSA